MRSEEPPEDRKLSTVKSWFSRSVSSISSQNGLVDTSADGNSSSVSVSKEGVFESGPGFTPLRQLSMRRSRPSGEIEKELGATSPSMTPKNITPLTPLTPLRWKSNPREQEEEEKAMERSRSGMPRDIENPRGKLAAGNGKEDRAAEGQEQLTEGAAHRPTNSVDELSTTAQAGNGDDVVNLEPAEGFGRKPASGDDVMTMTIEFLRARLISERSASKTAKLRVQQLSAKVSELEQKLEQAMTDRKKADVAAQEALMKLKLAESSNQVLDRALGEVSDRSISTSTKDSPLLKSRAGREDTKSLHQEMSSTEDLSRTNSYGSSVEDRDSTTKKQLPETVSKFEGRNSEHGRPDIGPNPQNISEGSQESLQRQDSRAAIESRLRNMWSTISEEMAAFAEKRSEEDVVREELMSWMGQVPSVLQGVIPSPTRNVPLGSETEISQPKLVETRPERSPVNLSAKGQLHATANRVALSREQFAAQENIQQEWERNHRESRRELEQFKGDDGNANRLPRASGGLQHADHSRGLNGVADHPSSSGSPHARLAKSKSSLDLPTRSNEYNSDLSLPHRDGPCVESDSWTTERPLNHGTSSRHRDPVYQNAQAERPMSLKANHLNQSRMHQERSSEPSMLEEAGREAWSERQLDQEAGLYYQDTGNGAGHPSNAGRGPSQWPSPNRSAEDGFRRSQLECIASQRTWDERDRRHSGRHQQAQPGDSEWEEPYGSSHPETTHPLRYRHHHPFDNDDWPGAEDYGVLDQQREPSSGLGRRQSYSGYPAIRASDSSRPSFDNAPGSYGDLHYSDKKIYGTRGPRRESFPFSKADRAPGLQYPTQAGRDDFANGEPQLSLGYGPAFDAPREGSPGQSSPQAGINKNISDVLRALHMAKANIQSGGAGAKEPRLSGEHASQVTGYGAEPSAQYMQSSRQGMAEQFNQVPLSKPSRPASHSERYDPYEADSGSDRYQYEGDPTGGTSTDTSYVDQLNVGKGIQFFFP